MKKFDIEAANGDLKIDNKALHYIGAGNVGGARLSQADVMYLFAPTDAVDTVVKASGSATQEILSRFGFTIPAKIDGALNAEIEAKFGKNYEEIKATFDLASASITADTIGYHKAKGEAGAFNISLLTKEGGKNIDSLVLSDASTNIKGNGSLSADGSAIERLDLSPVIIGKTHLTSLHYSDNTADGMTTAISGDSLDLSAYLEKDGDGDFSFEHFPAMDITLDIKKIYAANSKTISSLKGNITCDKEHCNKAHITGDIADKKFSFVIKPDGKIRPLTIFSEDAGGLLQAIDINRSMVDGVLTLTGKYENNALQGTLDIRDYTLKNARMKNHHLRLFLNRLRDQGCRH
jgi:hypothetical protein